MTMQSGPQSGVTVGVSRVILAAISTSKHSLLNAKAGLPVRRVGAVASNTFQRGPEKVMSGAYEDEGPLSTRRR